MALSLFNTQNLADATNMNGAQGIQSLTIGGVTYLYVTGYLSDSIAVFSLDPLTGDATLVDTVFNSDNADYYLNGLYELTVFEANGTAYVLAGGLSDTGLSVFEVQADGTLANIQNIADDATLEIIGNYAKAAVLSTGTTTVVFVSGSGDSGFSSFEVQPDGTLQNVANVADDVTLELFGVRNLEVVSLAGKHFLIAASELDNGISVFEVSETGAIVGNPFNLDDSADAALKLGSAEDIAVAQIGGVTWVYVSSVAENAINVFRMNPDGTLDFDHAVVDAGTLELNGAFEMEMREIGGNHYLLVSGLFDNGFTLFGVGADGSLTELQSMTDDGTLNLSGQGGATIVELDGVPYIYATGRYDNGFSIFRVDMPIAISYNGTTTEMAETLAGAVSVAPWGGVVTVVDPTLYDSAGETVHVSQDNLMVDLGTLSTIGNPVIFRLDDYALHFTVTGGTNSDVAVFGSSGNDETITTGGGYDTVFAGGGDDVVISGGGRDLITLGIGDDFAKPGDGNDVAYGGSGNDTIFTGNGSDSVYGGAGDDQVWGQSGYDDLQGQAGHDTLGGGDGNDTLAGNFGNDLMFGGSGDDKLWAGDGNDTLNGGDGADELHGGLGRDMADYAGSAIAATIDVIYSVNNAGAAAGDILDSIEDVRGTGFGDTVTGSAIGNRLDGAGGDDVLTGLAGNDTLIGADGNDTLIGNFGSDMLLGFDGNDALFGGEAADELWGGDGHDTLNGGNGNDTLNGSIGNDVANGGDGADQIDTGMGDDTATGGAGSDTFVFDVGDGHLRITDFGDDVDTLDIDLAGFGFADAAALVNSASVFVNAWGSTVMNLSATDQIILVGIGDKSVLIDDIVSIA